MDESQLIESSTHEETTNSRVLMHPRVIKFLSIVIIILGTISFGVGVASLAISLIVRCEFRSGQYGYDHTTSPYTRICSYYRTFSSPGLWCGSMYIATGIIGIFTSRRRNICFVVTLMTLTVVSNWVSLTGMVISIGSHFDKGYDQMNDYPLSLHVLSSLVTLTSLIVFIIQWIEFGYVCHAACCNGRKGYPKIRKRNTYSYRPLGQSQPVTMYPNSAMQPPPSVANYPGPFTPHPTPYDPDTVFLVKDQRVIGVLPQNLLAQQIFQPAIPTQN